MFFRRVASEVAAAHNAVVQMREHALQIRIGISGRGNSGGDAARLGLSMEAWVGPA